MSSGLAHRPWAMRARTRSCSPGISCRACIVSSVSNHPGRMALTWMLSAGQASARLLVSWTIPPLAAGIGSRKARPEDRRHAARVDDLAASGALHDRVHGPGHQKRAGQVRVQDARPLVEGQILWGLANVDARVVEQDARRSRSAQDRSGSGPHPDDGSAIPNGLGNLPENSMSVNLADIIGYSVVLAILVDSRPAALP